MRPSKFSEFLPGVFKTFQNSCSQIIHVVMKISISCYCSALWSVKEITWFIVFTCSSICSVLITYIAPGSRSRGINQWRIKNKWLYYIFIVWKIMGICVDLMIVQCVHIDSMDWKQLKFTSPIFSVIYNDHKWCVQRKCHALVWEIYDLSKLIFFGLIVSWDQSCCKH